MCGEKQSKVKVTSVLKRHEDGCYLHRIVREGLSNKVAFKQIPKVSNKMSMWFFWEHSYEESSKILREEHAWKTRESGGK